MIWNLETMESLQAFRFGEEITDFIESERRLYVGCTNRVVILQKDLGYEERDPLPFASTCFCLIHDLLIVTGEHLHLFEEDTLAYLGCLCCREFKLTQWKNFQASVAQKDLLIVADYQQPFLFSFRR